MSFPEQNTSPPDATFSTKIASLGKRAQMLFRTKAELSEKELIIGCINADPFSQEMLYKKHSSRMFGVCLRYCSDYHAAEDMLQEGFMKVYGAISTYRGEGSFEGWMRRIFVNTAIERYRKTQRVLYFDDLSEGFYLFSEEAHASLEAEDLLKLIRELPDGFREIFNLYAIEGYTHKEIADMLGISEGTSKSQLSRARNLLKKKLAESTTYYHESVESLGRLG